MKHVSVVIALACASCGGSGSGTGTGNATLPGTYSGTMSESFPCVVGADFSLTDTYVVTLSGATGTVLPKSCGGGGFDGTANDGTITVTTLTTAPCVQTPQNGPQITLTGISGTVANENPDGTRHIDVMLQATATINGATCSGGIDGMLFPVAG